MTMFTLAANTEGTAHSIYILDCDKKQRPKSKAAVFFLLLPFSIGV